MDATLTVESALLSQNEVRAVVVVGPEPVDGEVVGGGCCEQWALDSSHMDSPAAPVRRSRPAPGAARPRPPRRSGGGGRRRRVRRAPRGGRGSRGHCSSPPQRLLSAWGPPRPGAACGHMVALSGAAERVGHTTSSSKFKRARNSVTTRARMRSHVHATGTRTLNTKPLMCLSSSRFAFRCFRCARAPAFRTSGPGPGPDSAEARNRPPENAGKAGAAGAGWGESGGGTGGD